MLFARHITGALLAFTLSAAPACAEPAQFSEAQKAEIRSVVKDYLIKNPDVMEEALNAFRSHMDKKENERISSLINANYTDLSATDLAPALGNPKGSVVVIEFFDYQCGYCKKIAPDLEALMDENKSVKVVLREFPILGEASVFAAKAALASRQQGKYAEFHNKLMAADGHLNPEEILTVAKSIGIDTARLQADMQAPEVDGEIAKNYRLAQALSIQSTPTLLIGKKLYQGAVGLDDMKRLAQEELTSASGASKP